MLRIISTSDLKKDSFSERINNINECRRIDWPMKTYTQEEIDNMAITLVNMSRDQLIVAHNLKHPGSHWYRKDLVTSGGIILQNLFLLCLAAKNVI